ncbi:MAG: SulP family inorganic anion transporter, partial [Anaerolineales bacterium]|nr:SulP family inorganic anion transporter [Anaerolineales bacterium]
MDFPKGHTTFAEFSRHWLVQVSYYLTQPLRTAKDYQRSDLRADLLASLTVAVIMLPQAIAYALIAELPPQTGLYAAIVATLVGALWGSSRHLHTGPTNTTSLVVLSTLLSLSVVPGTREYVAAAAVMALLVGFVRLLMGLVHMGIFVTFVADSVVTGFTAGAGVLIAVGQLKHLLRLDISSTPSLFQTLVEVSREIPNSHMPSLILGLATTAILLILKKFRPSWPSAFIAIAAAAAAVYLLGLNDQGVIVLGELPRGLPPVTDLGLVSLQTIREMGTGVLAVAIIGLIEATSISRTIAARSRQYLNNDQEFVGQGLANIATGLLSGYPCSGSLTRSVINYEAGSRTQLGAVFSAIWVALAMILLAPLAAFLPRTALAGIIVVTAYSMFNRKEIRNILRTSPGDTTIMIGTFVATLLLPLELAILTGVLISFGRYVANTSTPDVTAMLPDDSFEHFAYRPDRPTCPQLGAITISGSLYFGAAAHIETAIREHHQHNPDQKILLLRMHRVNHIDVSGLHILENMVNLFRQDGGDIYMVGVRGAVWRKMTLSGFDQFLGLNHFLAAEDAIGYIFHQVMNPG